jgi:hypothetical protein
MGDTPINPILDWTNAAISLQQMINTTRSAIGLSQRSLYGGASCTRYCDALASGLQSGARAATVGRGVAVI